MPGTGASILHHAFIFKIGWFSLTGFGIAMLGAFLIAQTVAQSVLAERGHDANVMPDIVIAAVIGGLLGGKIYFTILMHDPSMLFKREGFVFWGGLAGGIVATAGWMRMKKISFTQVSDACAPALAAAYAVGRTGCWAVGDDYGSAWASRFAVRFPEGSPPSTVTNMVREFHQTNLGGMAPTDVVAVYPTQLLEVTLGLVMFAILWRLRAHKHAAGWLFGVYCVFAGIERFIVEFFRAKDDRFFGGFTMAQAIAVAFVIAGLAWMKTRERTGEGAPGVMAAA
jgi:phosphatidylglycerol:prolipoprotein diacylglycerol transferase